jgi:hypothetical protein
MNKKYQEYVEEYKTVKYAETAEPTESEVINMPVKFTYCPSVNKTSIPTFIPTNIIINEKNSNKNEINIELIIIILPIISFLIIIFFIGLKFKQLKYRMKIQYKNKIKNNKNNKNNENDNFGTIFDETIAC